MSQLCLCVLLQLDGGAKAPHTERSVQRLSERRLDFVEKLHVIPRYAVERQDPANVIQVNSNTRRARSREVNAFVIVHEGHFGIRAVQAPGLGIPAQTAHVVVAFATDSLVCYGDVYLRPLPVHFPVRTGGSQCLSAQHLLPVFEALWMVGVVLRLTLHRCRSVSFRKVQIGMDGVDIQTQLTSVLQKVVSCSRLISGPRVLSPRVLPP